MEKLITDALHFAKTVRQVLPRAPLDLDHLVRALLVSCPHLQAPRACVETQGVLPGVFANEAGLTECLSNLLGNAVKFVPTGVIPEVRLWAEGRGAATHLWVADIR